MMLIIDGVSHLGSIVTRVLSDVISMYHTLYSHSFRLFRLGVIKDRYFEQVLHILNGIIQIYNIQGGW